MSTTSTAIRRRRQAKNGYKHLAPKARSKFSKPSIAAAFGAKGQKPKGRK